MNDQRERVYLRFWKVELVGLLLVGSVCGRFPLFHVVPLKQAETQQRAARFDAAEVATAFWKTKLLPATEHAVDLQELLPALARDPAAARRRYGRSVGIGGATMFLVRGAGRVTAVEADAVMVALDGGGGRIGLATGLLFGNTVRDATGLLDVSAYPNSQDFNDLSTQLNGVVESKVVPALRGKAAVGTRIRFAACAELEEDAKPEVLSAIPLKVEWP